MCKSQKDTIIKMSGRKNSFERRNFRYALLILSVRYGIETQMRDERGIQNKCKKRCQKL